MALERTLSIVKPDGVQKNVIGNVYRRFEDGGLRHRRGPHDAADTGPGEGFYACIASVRSSRI
jgi:nucleoside-diphosphate kinase